MVKICIVYLVSPRDHTHTRAAMKKEGISKMEVFKESLKTLKKHLPEYPIIVFHEDYTEDDQQSCKDVIDNREIKFVKIDFNEHPTVENYQKKIWIEGKSGGVKGRPWGYRMMCRFFCGVMQNRPELEEYDYYIRLDHDSFFIDPKPSKSLEKYINETDFDYSLRSIFNDPKEKDALWQFTKDYLSKNNMYDRAHNLKRLGMLDGHFNYNGICPYNNYHVCKVDFWKRPDVKKYLDEIEKVNGIVKLHWQDANIHALLMGLFIEPDKILMRTDFGYRHNFHYSVFGGKGVQYIHNGRPGDWP